MPRPWSTPASSTDSGGSLSSLYTCFYPLPLPLTDSLKSNPTSAHNIHIYILIQPRIEPYASASFHFLHSFFPLSLSLFLSFFLYLFLLLLLLRSCSLSLCECLFPSLFVFLSCSRPVWMFPCPQSTGGKRNVCSGIKDSRTHVRGPCIEECTAENFTWREYSGTIKCIF